MDATRFAPPRPSTRHVARDRLLDLIDATPSGGLCVITGGPGFGKTQLLTDWIARPDVRAAWLSADASDNDPVRFWHHLGESCRRAGLAPAPTAGGADDRIGDLDGFVRQVLEPCAGAQAWLVIDDAHLLVDESLRADLARLVGSLAGDMRLAVASRVELPWSLSRWRARGLVIDIRERALHLDLDEVDHLVTSAGLATPPATVEQLVARTEGWAAGVQLAIRGALDCEDPDGYLAHVRGDDQSIADFLLEEALDHQPEEVRRFLLETSILDRLDGLLCEAVTGRRDSSRILAELARNHVLVNRLEGEGGPWYRCHALFAELLRSELTADDPALALELHRRAGAFLATRGEIDRAVHHLLAGGQADEAAGLVHTHEDVYFRLGEVALLQDLYASLPETAGSDPDDNLLRLIWASLAAGDPPEVWEPALHQLRRRTPLESAPAALVPELAVIDAHLAACIGDALTMGHRSNDAIEGFAALAVGRDRPAVAYASLLTARAAVWGDAIETAEEIVEAALTDPSVTDPFWVTAFEAARSYIDAEQGRHLEALARADAALARRGQNGPVGLGGPEAGLARVIALRGLGRAADAAEAVDRARAEAHADRVAVAPFLALLAVEEARLALDRGDLDSAGTALSTISDLPRFQRGRRDVTATRDAWRDAKHLREGTTALTERELEVLGRLSTRLTLQEIADELFVSLNTVKSHVKSIYAKLHVAPEDARSPCRAGASGQRCRARSEGLEPPTF